MKKKMILLAGTLICLIVVWSVMTGQRQQSYAEAELTDQDKIWIITEADRSLTTFLMPSDY